MSTEISTVQPRGLALDTFEDAFRFSASWWQPATLHQRTFAASRKAACWPSSTVRNLACRQCSRCRASQSSTDGRASTATRPWPSAKAHRSASGSARPSRAKASTWLPSARPSVAAMLSRSKAGLAWLKPRRPACGASKARGRSTHVGCCRCVLAALRCVTRFLTCCVALVTAEEAADYTHVEPEPVRVTQPTPTPPVADDAAMQKARAAIDLAKDAEQVRKFAAVVRQRVDDGFYA
jgi:hypothetical protein